MKPDDVMDVMSGKFFGRYFLTTPGARCRFSKPSLKRFLAGSEAHLQGAVEDVKGTTPDEILRDAANL